MDRDDYLRKFDGAYPAMTKQAKALELALDIRKFEIDLYWKRATYFWAFITAAFAGYGLVQKLDEPEKTFLSVIFACLGLVFSFGWFCVNRASKYWQENWENHVDILEDAVLGPLYKVVTEKKDESGFLRRLVLGHQALSVSKINQLISLFVVAAWVVLIVQPLFPVAWRSPADWVRRLLEIIAIGSTIVLCAGFLRWGRTGPRTAEIELHPRTVTVISKDATQSEP